MGLSISNIFLDCGIKIVICMPDSLISPLCKKLIECREIDYFQTIHESIACSIAYGINLTGCNCLVLMENSGLRNACETIARLSLSHNMYFMVMLTNRGEFGERNWWGVKHYEVSLELLKILNFRWIEIDDIDQLSNCFQRGISTLRTNQCNIAYIATYNFLEQVKRL